MAVMPIVDSEGQSNQGKGQVSLNGNYGEADTLVDTDEHVHDFKPIHTQNKEANTSTDTSRNHEVPKFDPNAIAIVGIGLRLPGDIHTTESLWDLIVNKRETRCLVPKTRYNIDGFYHTSKEPGSVAAQYGHFLAESDKLDTLDTSFFTISKAEAEQLDPQQRMLLEVVWECMENGGQVDWKGQNIGVFLGTFNEDWNDLLTKDTHTTGIHKMVSSLDFVVANRINYEYNLKGPSTTIKTACSASMIGVHEACQSILAGDCSSAIVAGTNLIMTPTITITMSEQGILSPQGRCRTFDADADGFARGEAINAIYLKKLGDAIANNDPIRGIIRGTAMNADGKTPGITMPSADAHERLIRQAYQAAGIQDFSQTAFFECHGTGTPVGDPLETSAVARVFGGPKGIYIGSIKTNVGHSEASSGISSIIKSILALENKTIPPNLHFSRPNPKIPFKEANLRVATEPMPWPAAAERISVNSFGIAGSNAHVIIDSAASFGLGTKNDINGSSNTQPKLLVFSARSTWSLNRFAESIQTYTHNKSSQINDLAYTLGVRREHLTWRTFCVQRGSEKFELAPATRGKTAPHITFVFTGQGAQWAGMARELLRDFSSFDADMRAMTTTLANCPDPPPWDLREELLKEDNQSNMNIAEYAQPISTAIQIALVNLLRALNVNPSSALGHSSGEVGAAYAAGAISQESAILIAYYRGQAMKTCQKKGSMAAVGMGRTEVNLYLKRGVVIGCENSQASVTLSGDPTTLQEVIADIKEDEPEVFARLLKVELAYHSPHMTEIGGLYQDMLEKTISARTPQIPFFSSSINGQRGSDTPDLGPYYWRNNLESPVLFHSAVEACLEKEPRNHLFIELGPHSALAGPLRQIFKQRDPKDNISYLSALVRGKDASETFLKLIGQLHLLLVPIDFRALTPCGKVLTDLPTYQWKHDTSYWNESRLTHDWRFRKFKRHELLGSRTLESTDIEPSWRNVLRIEDVPWLADHKIVEDIVFPCAGYVTMAGEAIRQISGISDYSIKDLKLHAALVLVDSKSVELITNLRPLPQVTASDAKWYEFNIFSHNKTNWIKHCVGKVRIGLETLPPTENLKDSPRRVHNAYKSLKRLGLNYGPTFQGLQDVTAMPGKTTATSKIIKTMDSETYYATHPTTIDHCLQLIEFAIADGLDRKLNKLSVPTGVSLLCVKADATEEVMMAKATSTNNTTGKVLGNVILMAGDKVVLFLAGGELTPLEDETTSDRNNAGAAELEWAPHIDFAPLETLIRPLRKELGTFDAVHKLTLLAAVEITSRYGNLCFGADYLQRFYSVLRDYIEQAQNGSLIHFNNVDVDSLIALTDDERKNVITSTIKQIGKTKLCAIGELISRVLDNAEGIFLGNISTIEVLIRENALTEVYNIIGGMVDCGGFFATAGHSKPTIRVLEIGAGTGGTSAIALRNLISSYGEPMYSVYTFTDISPGFFPTAKERFAQYQNIQYQVLDITKDPVEQGFDAGSYDLIIAANVLHATPHLVTTLKHVHKLLHPKGRLFLQELNPGAVQYVDLIMGGLRDWWLGANDRRLDRPYIKTERWDEDLRKAGFVGVEGVVYDDKEPNVLQNIVARPRREAKEFRRVTLLLGSNQAGGPATLVEEYLLKQGFTVYKCTLYDNLPAYQNIISLIDLERPLLASVSPDEFKLFMALLPKLESAGILWVMRSAQVGCKDPHNALMLGLARTIRSEMSITFTTLELDDTDETGCSAVVKVFRKFQDKENSTALDLEREYALVKGNINVSRYHWVYIPEEISRSAPETSSLHLQIGRPGQISSLQWQIRTAEAICANQVVVAVDTVPINAQDAAIVSCHADSKYGEPGLSACGTLIQAAPSVEGLSIGDRVLILGRDLFGSTVVVSAEQCIKLPESLDNKSAASISYAYASAIQGLHNLARVQRGESVLIHSDDSSIMLAAVQICKRIGATTLISTDETSIANFLIEELGLPQQHIFNFKESTSSHAVRTVLHDEGVDVICNASGRSTPISLLTAFSECGRWINIKNSGPSKTYDGLFMSNRSIFQVDLSSMSLAATRKLLTQTFEFLHDIPALKLLPVKIFPAKDVVDAFLHAQNETLKSTVVEINNIKAEVTPAPIAPRFHMRSDVAYLLIGGLGAVGKVISTWLVECGAKHLIYLSRSAGQSEPDKSFLRELESQGCTYQIFAGSVVDKTLIRAAIDSASKPIAGVLHMGMVLDDALLSEMTYEKWQTAMEPRVRGTWNLHEATLGLPLDFFILISSLAGVIGTRGQGNYAATNTFLDAFAQYRHSLGLTAYVVDVGATSGIGLIGSSNQVDAILQAQSFWFTGEAVIVEGLNLAILRSKLKLVSQNPLRSFVCKNHLTLGLRSSRLLSDPSNRVAWKTDIRMSIAHNMDGSTSIAPEAEKSGNLEKLLSNVESNPSLLEEQSTIDTLTEDIGKRVYTLMLQSPEEMNKQQTLEGLGVDSLVTIEIRSWWKRCFRFDVSTLEILNASTIKGLGELAVTGLRCRFQQASAKDT